jgi:hypothetical protein
MLEIRASIIHQERVFLLHYGGSMTQYCQRLEALYRKLAPEEMASHMQLSRLDATTGAYQRVIGDASTLPIDLNVQAAQVPAVSDVLNAIKRRKKQVSCHCMCCNSCAPVLKSIFVSQEQDTFEEACKFLDVPSATLPMALELKKFLRGVKRAMQSDTHLRNATIHLPPSPSLPNAVLDAGQFICPK